MTCQQTDSHADRIEQRRLWLSDELTGWDGWPGLQTVCKIERHVHGRKGQTPTVEVAYGISSVPMTAHPPEWFLETWRGHWHIENRLHWVRDVTMGEDACRVRSGAAPYILAGLRNAVLALIRQANWANIAAALRHHAAKPHKALRAIGLR